MSTSFGPVHLEWRGKAAVITLDNPPLNVTSQAVRAGLAAALTAAKGAERIVLTGAGRAFVAGADAKEFDLPPQKPHLPDIIWQIDASPAPVVAAVNGAALGGGLEIALAARARVFAPAAVAGLPEVKLGVIPGAGGTQRLTRLVGIPLALDLITTGSSLSAHEALDLRLADAVADDPVAVALTLPLEGLRQISALEPPAPAPEAVAETRKKVARSLDGQIAPLKAIELIEAAAHLSVKAGMQAERETFLSLRNGDQAAALRAVFFAERAALSRRKGQALPQSGIVIGGGTMGAGIAFAMLLSGMSVAVVETSAEFADRARHTIAKLADDAVARGKMTEGERTSALQDRLCLHLNYDALPPADVAIEAVFEDLALKREIFAKLEAALPATTLLASNTSFLDINDIAQVLKDPSRMLGLHFFSPAHVMKLLEVIRTDTTSPEALDRGFALARRLGKLPIEVGVCMGFVGNRILTQYRQICDVMLLEGALPHQIDAAMRKFGMAMGPYEVQDLSGLQIAHANRARLGWKDLASVRYVPIADQVVERLGRTGRRSGGGWYDYADGQAPSAEVEALILAASAEAGITRRSFTEDEIIARALTSMMLEGHGLLVEGVASQPSDIDLVLVNGYGFPRWRGGPMHMASRLPARELAARVAALAKVDPVSWSRSGQEAL